MAGGAWTTQNKVLPGLYINVKSNKPVSPAAGQRGVVAIPADVSWGEGLLEITNEDLLSGDSLYKIGLTSQDDKMKIIKEALQFCKKAYVYNTNLSGTKASATVGSISVTAKYQGTFGNRLTVSVVNNGRARQGKFDVITYVDVKEVDRQTVEDIENLVANDYVTFSGTGAPTANAGVKLTGGTDGTKDESYLGKFLQSLKTKKWDTLAAVNIAGADITTVVTFIKQMREELGKKVQAVINNPTTNPDYEGIIVTKQGYKTKDYEIKPEEFPATIAGMTAGADFTTSNTGRTIPEAIAIINELSEDKIAEEMQKGVLVLGYNAQDNVAISSDINSFISFTPEKAYDFSKNLVIRTLDLIANDLRIDFETKFLGKYKNSQTQRSNYKVSIVRYLESLVTAEAIEAFDANDIVVEIGKNIDSVYVQLSIQVIDVMEKIYMEVVVV